MEQQQFDCLVSGIARMELTLNELAKALVTSAATLQDCTEAIKRWGYEGGVVAELACLDSLTTSSGIQIGDFIRVTSRGGGELFYKIGDVGRVLEINAPTDELRVAFGAGPSTQALCMDGIWWVESGEVVKI